MYRRIVLVFAAAALAVSFAVGWADSARSAAAAITFEASAGTGDGFRNWDEGDYHVHGLGFLSIQDNDGDGDREAAVRKSSGGTNHRISISRSDGGAFDLKSIDIEQIVGASGCNGITVWGGSSFAQSSGTGTMRFGAQWSGLYSVLIGAQFGTVYCEAWVDNIELGGGSKGDLLISSGVPGNGLQSAPGLEKEFNPNSNAAENAGQK